MADNPEQETEKRARRQPSRITRLVESSRNNPQLMSEAHRNMYGFDTNDKFATDLAAYVRDPSKTPSMLASGDPQQVIDTIRDIYGVRVTLDYANDLLAFAEKGAKGD